MMTFPLISFMLFLGQSSFQETLCYQKPVVAIPVTGDQPINAREAEHLGIGISHYYSTMDEEQLYQARYFSRLSLIFTRTNLLALFGQIFGLFFNCK